SPEQRERVLGYLESASADGARLVTGGAEAEVPDEGWFVAPTVFDRVDPGMRIVREEVFGPVLTVQGFSGIDQAIEMMNDTDFGLLACIWTDDVSRALRVAEEVRSGQGAVNQFNGAGVLGSPFNLQ